MTQNLLNTPNGLIYRNDSPVIVTNSTAENPLVSGTLLPGTLSMYNRIKYTLICSLSTATLTPGTLTIRARYGTGLITLGGGALALIGGASSSAFKVTGRMANKTNTSTQTLYGELLQASGGLTLSQPVNQVIAASAVDSTASQTISISAQFSVASANNILTMQDFEMEIS